MHSSTALHLAVREKADYDIARILLGNGAELESLNTRFQTPLHSFFSPLIVQLARSHASTMEDMPADVRGMNLVHYFSWTNSSVPADFQCLPNVRALLDCRDAEGRTPIHLAAHRGNIAVMKYLLSENTSRDYALPDNKGNTAMHQAVLSVRAPDAIKLLLSHKYRLDVRNHKGHTPIQHAARCGTVEALSFLIEHEPALITCQDTRGHGLLALAEGFENRKVVAWLISKFGEQVPNVSFNRPQYQGYGRTQMRWDWSGLYSINCWLGVAVLLGPFLGYFLGSIYSDSRSTSKLEE
jgi:ankyrin repeat protein